jgi:Bacterial CdiA-CT RNAse A domain
MEGEDHGGMKLPFRKFSPALLAILALLQGCGQTPSTSAPNPAGPPLNVKPETRLAHYDLERDESRGGHTVKKHVGRSDAQLQERLGRERNISAASTWTDLDTADVTVAAALQAERGRVKSWMNRGYPRANLALHYDAGHPIGRSLRRGASHAVDCTAAVIVLRADGPDSFFVLTTYPEARE